MLLYINLQESHRPGTVFRFLQALLPLEKKRVWMAGRYWFKDEPIPLASEQTITAVDQCQYCKTVIEDECLRRGPLKWHLACFTCTICDTSLASRLSNACLVQSNQDDKSISTILVCTDCYTKQQHQHEEKQFEQNDKAMDAGHPQSNTIPVAPTNQAHLFIHTSRLEQHLDLVRSSLTQYFYMIAGNVILKFINHPLLIKLL